MKKGYCPKCKAQEVYTGKDIKFKKGTYGSNTIPLGGIFGGEVALDNYVCADCGYVESYINSEKDLKKIADRWQRVL